MRKKSIGLSLIILGLFLCAWVGASEAEPVLEASLLEILLREDFNDGVAQGFGNEVGSWKVVDGRYTATTGTFRFSTVAESITCNDYSLEANFINAKDGGFLIRAQDGNKGIALILRPTRNDIYWSEICWTTGKGRGWGARHEVKTLGHKPGEDLHLKVQVRGDEFKAYVNGEIKTIFRSTEFPKPKIALYLYRQSDQYWDNVVVRRLAAPLPEKKGSY